MSPADLRTWLAVALHPSLSIRAAAKMTALADVAVIERIERESHLPGRA